MSIKGKERKILLVCTANMRRSLMAEAIFNALATTAAGLPHEARSAGIAALMGKSIVRFARVVLEKAGVSPDVYRTRQPGTAPAPIGEHNLVLPITPQHATALRRFPGSWPSEVRPFLTYEDGVPVSEGLPVPHGQTFRVLRVWVRQLLQHTDALVERFAHAPRTLHVRDNGLIS